MSEILKQIETLGLKIKPGDTVPIVGGPGMGWTTNGIVKFVSDFSIHVQFTDLAGKIHEKSGFHKLTGERHGDKDSPPVRIDLPEYIMRKMKKNSDEVSGKQAEVLSDGAIYASVSP